MWLPLVLAASLTTAPAQAGGLKLANVRTAYGMLGPTRTDAKLLPGDSLFVLFDIEGVKSDDAGKILYSIGLEVSDAQGKVLFKQEPRNLEALNALGGNRLPAHAHIDIGVDQPPGSYTLKVAVADRATKASQTLTHKFEVLPRALALVRLRTTSDPEGEIPAPGVGVIGQALHINCGLVGFERDKAKKQPNVSVEMRVLDEAGKPTLAKPFTGTVNENVTEKMVGIPLRFMLPLNRPGKYQIEVRATDQLSKKTAVLAFPYTVIETK
jgi:hypothetical protein